jgi:hypothetical protein
MDSAFTEAILVTPMGALSVVVCAILSHFLLKEGLTFFVSHALKLEAFFVLLQVQSCIPRTGHTWAKVPH